MIVYWKDAVASLDLEWSPPGQDKGLHSEK